MREIFRIKNKTQRYTKEKQNSRVMDRAAASEFLRIE